VLGSNLNIVNKGTIVAGGPGLAAVQFTALAERRANFAISPMPRLARAIPASSVAATRTIPGRWDCGGGS